MELISPDLTTPYSLEDFDSIGSPFTLKCYVDASEGRESQTVVSECDL